MNIQEIQIIQELADNNNDRSGAGAMSDNALTMLLSVG
jgi:hypothetical protein